MKHEYDSTLQNKPFYKRPRTYIWAVLSVIGGLFMILLISVASLRWVNPPVTSFTLLENWESLEAERYNLRDHWVPSDEIPDHMKWAVVASEDQLFWEHNGFDMESIREAWEDRQDGIRSRGASSITQQVAKNLYLWPAESYIRKGIEAGITVLIEFLWPKERIMEVYLNIAEFGPGIYGIGKASDDFFGQPPGELQPEVSARFAAVLPNPKRMRVEPPSPYAKERSQWILRQMTQLSGIAYIKPDLETIEAEEPALFSFEPDTSLSFFFLDAAPDTADTTLIESTPDSVFTADTVSYSPPEDTLESLPKY